MEFLQTGLRRCEITGAEVYEGSVEELKRQRILHGDYFTAKDKFAVVTAWYDPRTQRDSDLFEEEADAIKRISQIEKRSPALDAMCRSCDNFGFVCPGSFTHIYSGCIMKKMSFEEFIDYQKAMDDIPKKDSQEDTEKGEKENGGKQL